MRPESFLRALGASVVWRGLENACALAKHVVVAAVIGLSAPLDVFYMANALLSALVFCWGTAIDSLAVPRLVALRQAGDEAGFRRLAGGVVAAACGVGALLGLAVWLAAGPLAWTAIGFEAGRRALLQDALGWLVPVVVLYAPMHALASVHRARRRFSVVSQGDFVTTAVILACVGLAPGEPRVLLWSYGVGLAAACAYLLARFPRGERPWGSPHHPEVFAVLRAAPPLAAAQLSTSAYWLTERVAVSFLPVATMGAMSYAWVLVALVPGLLMMQNAFITVFAEAQGTPDRGASLVDRLVTLALGAGIPVAGFLTVFGAGLIAALLERGAFGPTETALTAVALAGYAPSVVVLLLMPALRQVFQVLGRLDALWARGLVGITLCALSNAALLATGAASALTVACATSACQVVQLALAAHFLDRQGLKLAWARHLRWGAYMSAGVIGTAAAIRALPGLAPGGAAPAAVAIAGLIFCTVVAAWAAAPWSPEGPLVRGTLGRLRRERPLALEGPG